jgi:single-strand DNA-binding protein
MLNQCNFIGRCGRDPESKFTQAGKQVVNVSIACTEKYNGEERTEWVNLVFWGKLSEIVEKYVKKGSLIYVSGKMQTRKWEKDGQTHYATDINCREMKMLGSRKNEEAQDDGLPDSHNAYGPDPSEEDVPF